MNRVISIRARMNKSNKSSLAALLAACLVGIATLSTAAEREPVMVSAYYGSGSVIFFYGAEAVWTPGCECEWLTRYNLDPRFAVNVAYWKGHDQPPEHRSLWDVGGHAMLRSAFFKDRAVSPFVEIGTGVQLLSETRINASRYLGTHYQFGSRIGGGIAFGSPRRYELLAFLEHVSNASLGSGPNDGATYVAVQFRVGL
ncbi:MAG: acyloxyacyl hydrolase, partial [Betaproteobacteria bacterium]